MRRAPIVLAAAAALFSAFANTNAEAAIIRVTATGVVDHGVDGAGVFGQSGSNLVGQAYSAIFNIDTSKGYVTGGKEYFEGAGARYYSSELHNSAGKVAMNASLSIGANSVAIAGTKVASNLYDADLHDDNNDLYQEAASSIADLSFLDGFNLVYPVAPGGEGGEFHDPNLNPADLGFSSFGATFYNLGNFSYAGQGGDTNLSLDIFNLTYDVVSAGGGPTSFTSSAPEPGTWALMLAGVGMVGGALRFGRRRSGVLA